MVTSFMKFQKFVFSSDYNGNNNIKDVTHGFQVL